MKLKPMIYVAAPLTKGDMTVNINIAMKQFDELLSSDLITPICPHWSVFQNIFIPRPYEDWMQYDFQIIHKCDAILRLSGESPGGDREVALAKKLGIPVFFNKEELLNWAKTK